MCAATLPSLRAASPPRVAMATSAFFAASLIGFPLGGTHVHLAGVGLAGVLLGRAAFPAVLVGLVLQRFLLQYGGLTTLGVNTSTLGLGALAAAAVYWLPGRPAPPLDERARRRLVVRAGLAGALGTAASLALYGGALLAAERALETVAWLCIALHAPVVALEAAITALVVSFLLRVQPDLVGVAPTPADPPAEAAPGDAA